MTEEKKIKLEQAGINVNASVSRLGGNEKLFEKVLNMFPKDSSYNEMLDAIAETDSEKAYAAAHTLKGVAGNLSMNRLFKLTEEQSNHFKNGQYDKGIMMIGEVTKEYKKMVEVIESL